MEKSISGIKSIEIMEISGISLKSKFAIHIRNIIHSKGERLNQSIWLSGLRTDKKSAISLSNNIYFICLKSCSINDDFINLLYPSLSYNQFLRVYLFRVWILAIIN